MSLIRLENVSLVRQGKTLLSDLNWTVEKGQTWAILGLNGAGKSTLLRLLTAEFFPSEGKAGILGYTFGNGDITGLRQHIGIVSSFITERLPQHMTAEKIVLTGKYNPLQSLWRQRATRSQGYANFTWCWRFDWS